MKYWKYITGAFALVLGLLFLERSKRKSAEALNDNNEALKEVQELNGEIEKNKGLLEAEEEKRKEIEKETKKAKENTEGDAAFFNGRGNK